MAELPARASDLQSPCVLRCLPSRRGEADGGAEETVAERLLHTGDPLYTEHCPRCGELHLTPCLCVALSPSLLICKDLL